MKVFKRIYYPALAVLLVLMFVLSFVGATVGSKENKLGDEFIANVKTHLDNIAASGHNSVYSINQENVRNYITGRLAAANIRRGDSYVEEDDRIYTYALTSEGKPAASYVVQTDEVSVETQKYIDEERNAESDSVWAVGKEVSNIIVYIPGQKTLNNFVASSGASGDVVMMMAHYDSRIEGAGASDNGTQVASMLENIISITKSGETFDNDLLFVFTDAEEEGMYGAFMFKHQFLGFDDIYSRVKLGTNFDALGNKGTLVMFESSDNNYKLISEYSKINGSTFTSSIADFVYGGMTTYTDFSIYDDIASLNFANVGGSEVYHTSHDSIDNVYDSTIIQQANMMNKVIKTFGNRDLGELESSSDAVFFSYLGVVTIVYPYVVSYVLGALIVLLLLGVVVANKKKGTFSFGKTGGGAVVQLLSVISTVVSLIVLFYGFSLLMSAMGIIPFRAIGKLTYFNPGLIVSYILLAVVLSAAFNMIFKRVFGVKSADVVRGNVLVWSILGAVLAFAAPHLSYFFTITALLESLMLLFVTLFSKSFKNKYGTYLGTLFPYVLPLIIALPMVMPVIVIASIVLKMTYLPAIMALFVLMSGFITPHFSITKKFMDKLFNKLPKATRRIQEEVTEMVEDKAKKGKFVEKTYVKVVREKYSIKYQHAYGISLLAFILSIFAIVFSSLGLNMGKNFMGNGSYRNSVYNSSMVLVWEKIDSQDAHSFIEVRDVIAYKYIGEAVGDMKWDFDRDAYVKDVYSISNVISMYPSISVTGKEYSFTVFDSVRSIVTLKITGAENITSLSITGNGETYEYDNEGVEKSTITINIPQGFGNFKMSVAGADYINIEYTEHVMDLASTPMLSALEEWTEVLEYFSGDSDITEYINSGVVFRVVKNNF